MSAAARRVTISEAVRHPAISIVRVMSGRKTSCPVAQAAPKRPITRPRRAVNQRFATSAPKTSAVDPTPSPTSTPQRITSCHEAFITSVRPVPVAMSARAATATCLIPNRSMSAAAKGAVTPYRTRFTETAREMADFVQPNSSSKGRTMTPMDDRNAADARSTRNVTPATIQARCTRTPTPSP